MTKIPKALYGIKWKYGLESTSFNPHYMIYKSKKVAERNASKIRDKYLKSNIKFLRNLADYTEVVEYRLVEDEGNK